MSTIDLETLVRLVGTPGDGEAGDWGGLGRTEAR